MGAAREGWGGPPLCAGSDHLILAYCSISPRVTSLAGVPFLPAELGARTNVNDSRNAGVDRKLPV